MSIADLMRKDPVVALPDDSLNDAARIMWEYDCGFIPVVSSEADRRPVGVITDRDICMCAYTRGADLKSLRVRDAMSSDVVSCRASATTNEASSLMMQAQVRRLPIVDDDDRLIGVLSLADLARRARASGAGGRRRNGQISESQVGELVRAISQPHEAASRSETASGAEQASGSEMAAGTGTGSETGSRSETAKRSETAPRSETAKRSETASRSKATSRTK